MLSYTFLYISKRLLDKDYYMRIIKTSKFLVIVMLIGRDALQIGSTTRYGVFSGGKLISRRSKKQNVVWSSAEAEQRTLSGLNNYSRVKIM